MSGTLVTSGNELTDAVRTAGINGDGLAVPAGVGIYGQRQNLCTNGGFETDLSGWLTSDGTPARSQTWKKFGSWSAHVTNTINLRYPGVGTAGIATTPGTVISVGAWLNVIAQPVSSGFYVSIDWYSSAGTFLSNVSSASPAPLGVGLLTVTGTAPANAAFYDIHIQNGSGGTTGEYYCDGVMLNTGLVALPYCEGTIPACRVQAPASLLNATQGWVAMRLKMGFASAGPYPNGNANTPLFFLSDGTANNYIWATVPQGAFVQTEDGGHGFVRVAAFWNVGDTITVIAAWTASSLYVSFNGGALVSAGRSGIASGINTFDIGSLLADRWIDSNILWFAAGTGTLTNQDAATINTALVAGKQWALEDFNAATAGRAQCTASWPCVDATYVNEAFLIIDPDSTGQSRGLLPHLKVELDVTNKPTNSSRVWTDITSDVRSLSFSRAGRMNELQQTQPGTLTATVGSKNAKYDPTNGSGIGIKRTQWLRVRARWGVTDYQRWQGVLTNISQAWPQAGVATSVVTLTAADAMKVLTLFDLNGQSFPSERSDQRMSAICTLAGVTAQIDDNGQSTLIASSVFGKQSFADQHLQQVEQTENGLIFAGPEGAMHFQSRHYRTLLSQTAKAVIGDTTGTVRYRDSATVDTDDQYLVNYVTVTPTNPGGGLGTDQVAQDATSISNHFQRSSSTVDKAILVADPSEALACAQWLVGRYKEPSPRIAAAELIGSQISRLTPMWAAVLGANNSDRFTFKRTAPGNTISQDCFVEKIAETVVPQTSWNITLQLSPADTAAYWVAGVAGFSEAGTTTVASY